MPVKKKTKATPKKPTVNRVAKAVVRKRPNPKYNVFKTLLLKIKEKILRDIRHLADENNGSSNDRSGDISGHAMHMADVATDMYDREFTLGLAANERELLTQVSQALARIEDGTYGACLTCTKPIPATRLKAIPHAKLCLKCQEKSETRR